MKEEISVIFHVRSAKRANISRQGDNPEPCQFIPKRESPPEEQPNERSDLQRGRNTPQGFQERTFGMTLNNSLRKEEHEYLPEGVCSQMRNETQ